MRIERRTAVIGGGALLLVLVVVFAVIAIARSGPSEGTQLAAHNGSASASPGGDGNLESRKPAASPKASKRATEAAKPTLKPPQSISGKVDWSPFSKTYGASTAAATGHASTSNGITHVQASQSFGDYNGTAMVSITADAQYFDTASDARGQYDSTCGSGSAKKSGSTRTADIGDKACSYISDVSNGSSGSVILYVEVLRNNVILQVAPMAFHNGAWSDPELATLRSVSTQCAGNTITTL